MYQPEFLIFKLQRQFIKKSCPINDSYLSIPIGPIVSCKIKSICFILVSSNGRDCHVPIVYSFQPVTVCVRISAPGAEKIRGEVRWHRLFQRLIVVLRDK